MLKDLKNSQLVRYLKGFTAVLLDIQVFLDVTRSLIVNLPQ